MGGGGGGGGGGSRMYMRVLTQVQLTSGRESTNANGCGLRAFTLEVNLG